MPLLGGLIDELEVPLPRLPVQLEGLRIAHLSDLHISTPRRRHRRIARELASRKFDLLLLTGDYIAFASNAPVAREVIARILADLRPRLGTFGVFGNHDTPEVRELFSDLPVRWLDNAGYHFESLPMHIMGFGFGTQQRVPDVIETLHGLAASNGHRVDEAQRPLRLLLCHKPTYLPTAADLRVDLMFSGHTHGGQVRLPLKTALVNSCDLPARLSSGVLRHRDTLCVVTRGLGESWLPMRVLCSPHIPLYTLRRGKLPGESSEGITNVRPW